MHQREGRFKKSKEKKRQRGETKEGRWGREGKREAEKRYENTQAANDHPKELLFLLLDCVYLTSIKLYLKIEGEERKGCRRYVERSRRVKERGRGEGRREGYTNITIPKQKHVKETAMKMRNAMP